MTSSFQDIPIMDGHTDLINRVLDRHNIRSLDLAIESQLSESLISRTRSGQRIVCPQLFRAIYKLTSDPELITYLFDCREFTLVKHTHSNLAQPQIELLAVRSCAMVMAEISSTKTDPDSKAKRRAEIEEAITNLMSLNTALAPHTQDHTQQPLSRLDVAG